MAQHRQIMTDHYERALPKSIQQINDRLAAGVIERSRGFIRKNNFGLWQ